MKALHEYLDEIMLSLRPRKEFHPIPPASDREAWHEVRQATCKAAIKRAESYMGVNWQAIYATDIILAAVQNDIQPFAGKYAYRRNALSALALGEAIEGKGRFLSDIINLCFMICEETAWTLPENLTRPDGAPDCLPDIERPLLDIGAARTGELLATTLYMHREKFREASPLIAVRIEREITLRVIDPFINTRALCFERIPGEVDLTAEGIRACLAALLFTEREDRYRWGGIKHAMALLDDCLDRLPADGNVPGGMGNFEYGAGCIMECLELISEATGGRPSFFMMSALRNIGDFIISNHIYLDYFNCPDSSPAHLAIDANLLYRCGELIRSDELKALSAYLMRLHSDASYRILPLISAARAVTGENAMLRHDARPPMPMDYYLRSEALFCARSRTGTQDGFFVSFAGGVNRPGGHADAGNISLFFNGEPVLPDLGDLPYASSLSPEERAALWETQSQYHNLPVINNRAQAMGIQYMATEPVWEIAPERSRATLDISHAYPDDASVISWQRTVAIIRNERPCVRLWEVAEFGLDSNEIEFNFITTQRPYIHGNIVDIGNVRMTWDEKCTLTGDVWELPPRQSKEYDPENLYSKWLLELCGRTLYHLILYRHGAPKRFSVCFAFTMKPDL